MTQNDDVSYTTEDLAELLQVSKLTIYDLIKKGDILAYRVGRQMRVDVSDFEDYKNKMKGNVTTPIPSSTISSIIEPVVEVKELPLQQLRPELHLQQQIIISGQDVTLDLLANEISAASPSTRTLRSHTGSLTSLLALVNGESDLVSTHLFDGDTGSYNLPYIRRILIGREYTVIRLLSRSAGFYVQQGNPKNILSWRDLNRNDVRIINRELGSGIRVLTDEKLRLEGILSRTISGYDHIEMTHLAVASRIASGDADVGIGIEKMASLVNVDYIPLAQEQYDLVMIKREDNVPFRKMVTAILQSDSFKKELSTIKGYDFSQIGTILYDTP